MIYRYSLRQDVPENQKGESRTINGIRLSLNAWIYADEQIYFGKYQSLVLEERASSREEFLRKDSRDQPPTVVDGVPLVPIQAVLVEPEPVEEHSPVDSTGISDEISQSDEETTQEPVQPAEVIREKIIYKPLDRLPEHGQLYGFLRQRGFTERELRGLSYGALCELMQIDDALMARGA